MKKKNFFLLILLGTNPACGQDKQVSETGVSTSAATETSSSSAGPTEGLATTSSSGGGGSNTTANITEASSEATAGSSDTGEASSTGPDASTDCRETLSEVDCLAFNEPGAPLKTCLWVRAVNWTDGTPCPDLNSGTGMCILQDFTNDCSVSTTCKPERIFGRQLSADTYQAFAHPEGCGTPIEFTMCTDNSEPAVCQCFGCPG